MFTFDVGWTRGKSDTTFTKVGGGTDRPYGIWPGLVYNGNVVLKDTDRDFTLNSDWYDYDEQSQYNADGTKNGEYDKSQNHHHADTSSRDRALEKVLAYYDQGVGPEGYHYGDANSGDTPYTETGAHDHDVGHVNGSSGEIYGPRPGETGYAPSTQWIPQPGVSASDVLRDLTASYPPRDLPTVIAEVAEGPDPEGGSWWSRWNPWNFIWNSPEGVDRQVSGWRFFRDGADGGGVTAEGVARGLGRSRISTMLDSDIMRKDFDISREFNPRFSEDDLNFVEQAGQFNINHMAGRGLAAKTGAGIKSAPAHSKEIAKPHPAPGVPKGETPAGGNGGFSGHRGFELSNHPAQPVRNQRTWIGTREYSGHALDQMQNRGIPPSVVENTIQNGTRFEGSKPGTHGFYDPINRVRVILDSASERVITVIPGR